MSGKGKKRRRRAQRPRGRAVSATEAQNNFGRVLGDADREGVVYITKYDRPTAVVMSIETFERLSESDDVALDDLEREFDDMLARMQTPDAEAAADEFFRMGSGELAEAARRDAERDAE